jgi:phosphoenolpyruvate synthase/pyruvate phosphate dikinase
MNAVPATRLDDIADLSDPRARTFEKFGGKAARLATMRQAGFAVPDGAVIAATAFSRMFEQAGLTATAGDLLGADLEIEDVSARLRKALLASDLPSTVGQQASAWLDAIGPLAVRSSAVREDGVARAGAGQYESLLAIADDAGLERACKEVLASQFSPRALRYWGRSSRPDNGMAVILQRMLAPSASGVIFTCDPVSGERDTMVFEAARGLATSVVQGDGVAERTTVRHRTYELVSQELYPTRGACFFDAASHTLSTRADESAGTAPVLSADQRIALLETAGSIEDLFGAPVDVEWSIEHDRLFVLQARPVTAIGWTA